MDTLRQALDRLIREGESIVIAYNGGSRPGVERAVIPVLLSADELIARELGQRQAKAYKLDKIASFRSLDGLSTDNPGASALSVSSVPDFETFDEYVPFFELLAEERRWHVVKQANYFAICGHFKNGKPKTKSPTASIQFIDRSTTTVVDISSGEILEQRHEVTGRERPWRVDSKRMGDGKAFGLLQRASALFVEELLAASAANNDA